jgi:hypothetical protein
VLSPLIYNHIPFDIKLNLLQFDIQNVRLLIKVGLLCLKIDLMLHESCLVRFQNTEETKIISVHTSTEFLDGEMTTPLQEDRQFTYKRNIATRSRKYFCYT